MPMETQAVIVAAICLLILAAAFLVVFGAKSERDILTRMKNDPAGPAAAAGPRARARAASAPVASRARDGAGRGADSCMV